MLPGIADHPMASRHGRQANGCTGETRGQRRSEQLQVQVTRTDLYIHVSKQEAVITYSRPKGTDRETIQQLKDQSERAFEQLRNLVEKLLERQGMAFNDLSGKGLLLGVTFRVDDQAIIEAQALIDEGGPFSPEAVSDRIVQAAKAFSGGDKSKLEILRGAIDAGFRWAATMFGGTLPEISHITYDRIMEKLDAWKHEGSSRLVWESASYRYRSDTLSTTMLWTG